MSGSVGGKRITAGAGSAAAARANAPCAGISDGTPDLGTHGVMPNQRKAISGFMLDLVLAIR